MLSLPLLFLYAFIGLVEWALALIRTLSVVHHKVWAVPVTVFAETLIGMLVFKHFVDTGDWLVAVAYSVGSAIGSFLPMIWTKRKVEESNGTN
jgi:hypothetical protein